MEKIQIVLLLFAAFSLSCDATDQSGNVQDAKARLYRDLLYSSSYLYDVEPPLEQGATNTTVTVGLTLLCATPVGDFVSIESWSFMMWKDSRLSWDPSEYGGVDILRISPYSLWKPDLRLYNAYKTEVTETMAVVTSDGSVLWVPPVNFLVRCEHTNNDITNCTLKFGSWTYSADLVDIREREPSVLDLQSSPACPSVVQSHQSKHNVVYYESVPEPYTDITISLQLAWRPRTLIPV